MALMATGAIWTRWCFIIKPRNLFLAAVNFFLFIVGTTQVTRILMYRQSQKGTTIAQEVKDQAKEQGKVLESEVKAVEARAKQAMK
jgi:mitochondrial pyruvate carrier 2